MRIVVFLVLLLPIFSNAQSVNLSSIDSRTVSITPKDTLHYHLDLQKNQFAFMRFEQTGTDIVIHVKSPEGRLLMEFDAGNGANGPELVQIVSSKKGSYLLDVFMYEGKKRAGTFTFHLEKIVDREGNYAKQLDQFIGYCDEKGFIPGFSVSVFTKDQLLYQRGFGYADLASKKPYTPQSIQNIGSVSKTLIGISLMMAVRDGKLALDDPINKYLPYKVTNPYFPDQLITIRQLANHTSSIAEMDEYEMTYILKEPFNFQKGEISKGEFKEMRYYSKNEWCSMAAFMEALFSTEGRLYKKKNFLKQAPGAQYSYSNAGATLAAYIIERIYGMPYKAFTKKYILEALDMNNSAWSFEDIDLNLHSDLHFYNHKVIPKYTLITYPDGGLLTNNVDLTKYVQAQMKGYAGEKSLLSKDAYQEMMTPSLSESQQERKNRNYGIFWSMTGTQIGHNGGDPGIVVYMRFRPEEEIGFLFMMNMIPNTPLATETFRNVWGIINDFGMALFKQASSK